MESTYTMTPLSVIIRELRERGVRITHCSQLQRICFKRWEMDKKTQPKEKLVFTGMDDWLDHEQLMRDSWSEANATTLEHR